MQPRFIFITGGSDENDQLLNVAERYDSIRNTWALLPFLNIVRANHSSCTLGKTLYVLGGFSHQFHITNTIEKLSNINEPALI